MLYSTFVNMTKAHINTTAQSKLVVYAPLYSYLQKPFTENSLLLISLVFDPFTKILVDCVDMGNLFHLHGVPSVLMIRVTKEITSSNFHNFNILANILNRPQNQPSNTKLYFLVFSILEQLIGLKFSIY